MNKRINFDFSISSFQSSLTNLAKYFHEPTTIRTTQCKRFGGVHTISTAGPSYLRIIQEDKLKETDGKLTLRSYTAAVGHPTAPPSYLHFKEAERKNRSRAGGDPAAG